MQSNSTPWIAATAVLGLVVIAELFGFTLPSPVTFVDSRIEARIAKSEDDFAAKVAKAVGKAQEVKLDEMLDTLQAIANAQTAALKAASAKPAIQPVAHVPTGVLCTGKPDCQCLHNGALIAERDYFAACLKDVREMWPAYFQAGIKKGQELNAQQSASNPSSSTAPTPKYTITVK